MSRRPACGHHATVCEQCGLQTIHHVSAQVMIPDKGRPTCSCLARPGVSGLLPTRWPAPCCRDSSHPLNIHIVCHTHDDSGWLKTVDQYYWGANNRCVWTQARVMPRAIHGAPPTHTAAPLAAASRWRACSTFWTRLLMRWRPIQTASSSMQRCPSSPGQGVVAFPVFANHCHSGWIACTQHNMRTDADTSAVASHMFLVTLRSESIAPWCRWWDQQDDDVRALVTRLVEDGQLDFVNGGYVQVGRSCLLVQPEGRRSNRPSHCFVLLPSMPRQCSRDGYRQLGRGAMYVLCCAARRGQRPLRGYD